jgi:hypothetical protein
MHEQPHFLSAQPHWSSSLQHCATSTTAEYLIKHFIHNLQKYPTDIAGG